ERDETPKQAERSAVEATAVEEPASESDLTEPLTRDEIITASESFMEDGKLEQAEERLQSLLVVDPDDVEVIFRLANIRAGKGDLAGAVELLDSIPFDHPEAGFPALGQSADWCLQLRRYDDAERRYRRILDRFPGSPVAHRKLAFLYNCQGRRHEAAAHVYELCRQGNVRQDELHSLIHLSHAMHGELVDQSKLRESESAEEGDYRPIGEAADARLLFTQEKYQDAAMRLEQRIAAGGPPSVSALYGRAAAEAQDEDRLTRWLSESPEAVRSFAEYWAALGLWLISENRYEEAARALLEAVDRDPTDVRSVGRLRSVMETLGRSDEAAQMEQRAVALQRLFAINNRVADATTPDLAAMESLAKALVDVGRPLEAVLWRTIGAYHRQAPRDAMLRLNAQLGELAQADASSGSRDAKLCGIDLDQFALPRLELRPPTEAAPKSGNEQRRIAANFRNLAEDLGIDHAYQVAAQPQPRGFSVYQSVGGAVAVLDFDCDGNTDLYFAQGGADPPNFIGDQTNQLYRNLVHTIAEVTESSGTKETRYSTGVTAGDWNQDGFDDLIIANIGSNVLLLNNGDGTFTRSAFDNRDDKTLMTTSLAIADLTGDAIPEVFELNYLHDPEISRRPKTGPSGAVLESLMPQEFQPGLDRMIVQSADGTFSFREMKETASPARAGLGVVVGDFDHQVGNEVFVGNDVYANQLWRRGEDGAWDEIAMQVGCAYGFSGAKTASMGIAAADFDRNGWLDFHITNFQGESVSHYINSKGLYRDRNLQYALAAPSQSVLGFGTQALDYENDGDADLVVANGHIEDVAGSRAPFAQPAQLLENLGDRFELCSVTDDSGYWVAKHVGRGLARLDWNRDGKLDFVVTHLGECSALLINQTESENNWIQFRLRGVESERDAIGARIELRRGESTETQWVVSGDGFFSRNEPLICFGLGAATAVDEVRITWPSGNTQSIANPEINRRFLVVEKQTEPFPL
ncbi:MAG: FG-GAP-like repeat-containing protein, partial [Planctomycetota bacterium]